MATGVAEGSSSLEYEPPQYKFSCSPCSKDGRYVEAVCWCVNCEENFCSACLNFHGKFNMTRDHEILDGERMEDWDKVKASLLPKERCSQHHARVTDMYCGDHNVVGCATCMAEHHKDCDSVGYIPKMAEGIKDSREFLHTKKDTAELITEIKRLTRLREEDLERVEKEKEDTFKNIADFKEKILKKFDELERRAKEEIEELLNKYKTNIAGDIKRLNDTLDEGERIAESVENFVGDNESQLFVHVKKGLELSKKLDDLKEEIDEFHDELRFEFDDSILEYHEKLESIGKVVEKTNPVSLNFNGFYNVKANAERATCDITGCCLLEDGTLVVTDYANISIKHLDFNYIVIQQKNVTEEPTDICCTGGNSVAIALKRHIQFAKVNNTIALGRLVCVNDAVWGIEHCNERVFASCEGESGKVRIYSVDGTLLNTIAFQIERCCPGQFLVTGISDVIVSDGEDRITLYDNNGTVLWTFHHDILSDATCVRRLDDRSLLVLGRKSNNLLLVAMKGSRHKVLLGDADGLNAPYSMAYDKMGQKLIVVSDETDKIAVYDVKQCPNE